MEKTSLFMMRTMAFVLMLVFIGSFPSMEAFAEKSSSFVYTPSPMFGYDPAIGFILGGAVFTYPAKGPGWVTSNQIIYATEGLIKLELDYSKASTPSSLGYGTKLSVGQGLMRYFGEGGQTQVNQMVNVFSNDLEVKPFIEFWIDETKVFGLQIRTLAGYVTQVSDPKNNPLDKKHAGGLGETSSSMGLFYKQDSRNRVGPTTEGKLFRIEGNLVPSWLSSLSLEQNVFQVLTNYDQLIPWGLSNVFVYRLKAGTTLDGSPSFLYRYTLGGSSEGASSLRGYYFDRFRGNHFYGAQLENRTMIIDGPFPLSGAFFVDVGDVANQTLQDFSYLKVGCGVGLRIGLPPEGKIKIRVDFGIGKDQSTFVVGFNEVI